MTPAQLRCSVNPADFTRPGRPWYWLENSAIAVKFLRDRIPHRFRVPIQHRDLIRVCKGKLAAVVMYSDRNGGTVQMSCAADSPSWLSHDFLREAFSVPFIVWNCFSVIANVSGLNARSLKMVEGLGFIRTVEKDGFVSFTMTRSNCGWIH